MLASAADSPPFSLTFATVTYADWILFWQLFLLIGAIFLLSIKERKKSDAVEHRPWREAVIGSLPVLIGANFGTVIAIITMEPMLQWLYPKVALNADYIVVSFYYLISILAICLIAINLKVRRSRIRVASSLILMIAFVSAHLAASELSRVRDWSCSVAPRAVDFPHPIWVYYIAGPRGSEYVARRRLDQAPSVEEVLLALPGDQEYILESDGDAVFARILGGDGYYDIHRDEGIISTRFEVKSPDGPWMNSFMGEILNSSGVLADIVGSQPGTRVNIRRPDGERLEIAFTCPLYDTTVMKGYHRAAMRGVIVGEHYLVIGYGSVVNHDNWRLVLATMKDELRVLSPIGRGRWPVVVATYDGEG